MDVCKGALASCLDRHPPDILYYDFGRRFRAGRFFEEGGIVFFRLQPHLLEKFRKERLQKTMPLAGDAPSGPGVHPVFYQ